MGLAARSTGGRIHGETGALFLNNLHTPGRPPRERIIIEVQNKYRPTRHGEKLRPRYQSSLNGIRRFPSSSTHNPPEGPSSDGILRKLAMGPIEYGGLPSSRERRHRRHACVSFEALTWLERFSTNLLRFQGSAHFAMGLSSATTEDPWRVEPLAPAHPARGFSGEGPGCRFTTS